MLDLDPDMYGSIQYLGTYLSEELYDPDPDMYSSIQYLGTKV
jgi:hypothetical protein